jgi:hypothetical protein
VTVSFIDVLLFLKNVVAYGGGSAAIAYFTFKHFGKSWIENVFAQRLEHYKHGQTLELQRLRVEIDSLLDRTIKLQDREFQILPEAWQKLDEAYGLLSWISSPLQTYPDFSRMSSAELEEFLTASELSGTQKDDVRSAGDKNKKYQEIIGWHRLNRVQNAIINLRNYVARNGIFLPADLKDQFTKIIKLFNSVLVDNQMGHEFKDYKMKNQGWEKLQKEIEPLYKSIEDCIQNRLHSHNSKS